MHFEPASSVEQSVEEQQRVQLAMALCFHSVDYKNDYDEQTKYSEENWESYLGAANTYLNKLNDLKDKHMKKQKRFSEMGFTVEELKHIL